MMATAATPSSSRSASGVEHLAERRDLVEVAGHVAVDPVGDPQAAEQQGGRVPAGPVRAGQQPHEQRDAEQADQREPVGHGEDAVLPLPASLAHDGSLGVRVLRLPDVCLAGHRVSSPDSMTSPRPLISTT